MPKPSHKDFSCILNMLDSIKRIQQYSSKFANADDFYADTLSFDASMMNFIVIGEMVASYCDIILAKGTDGPTTRFEKPESPTC